MAQTLSVTAESQVSVNLHRQANLKLCGVWDDSIQAVALADDEVHIWRLPLSHASCNIRGQRNPLTRDELERANRFHSAEDSNRFIRTRSALRNALSRYVQLDAAELRFNYSRHGKPSLAPECNISDVRFNLSYSFDLAVFAIALGRELGIDVEQLRHIPEAPSIAHFVFSKAEATALKNTPPELLDLAFLNCWTRKEALIKARGEGLTSLLSRFTVSLTPGEPATVLETQDDLHERDRWTLYELDLPEVYIAVVAVENLEGSKCVRPKF